MYQNQKEEAHKTNIVYVSECVFWLFFFFFQIFSKFFDFHEIKESSSVNIIWHDFLEKAEVCSPNIAQNGVLKTFLKIIFSQEMI